MGIFRLLVPIFLILLLFFHPEHPPPSSVYLISPPNGTYTKENNETLEFIYTRSSSLKGVVNCSLYVDGKLGNYSVNVSSNAKVSVHVNFSLVEGKHWWWVVCTNGSAGESSVDTGGNWSLWIDRSVPDVNFQFPTPPTEVATNRNYVEVNISANDSSPISIFLDWNHSLVGYWSFEWYNESGVFDNSSYGNFAWFVNLSAENLSYGRFGRGLRFGEGYIKVANSTSLNLVENFTISLWIKPEMNYGPQLPDAYYMFVEAVNGWGYLSYEGWVGRIVMVMRIGATQDTLYCRTNLTEGKWYHIAAVRRGTNGWIYVNGNLCSAETVVGGTLKPLLGPLKIGEGVNGTLDEIQIWNRALSGDEIRALYQAKSKLLVNSTGLEHGKYVYRAYAIDSAGNINITETRSITIDSKPPKVNFVEPTPPAGVVINKKWVAVNVTVDDFTNTSAFIDWNNSLVGYWSFEYYNESGVFDNSSYGSFAWFTGGLSSENITYGKFGKGLEFNGSGYLESQDFKKLRLEDTNLSIALWIKTTTDSCAIMKVGATGGRITIENDLNKVRVYAYNDSGAAFSTPLNLPPLPQDKWVFFVVTKKGKVIRLYGNGKYYTSFNITGTVNLTKPVFIGAGTFGTYFKGILDEVRIWNRALSPEEINASYHAGLHRLERNFTGLEDGKYEYRVYVIDSAGNVNVSGRSVWIDTVDPEYLEGSVSGTRAGEKVSFDVKWRDNIGLKKFVFLFDNCRGSFEKVEGKLHGEREKVVEINKRLRAVPGCLVKWKVLVEDLAGNWKSSPLHMFRTTSSTKRRSWDIAELEISPEEIYVELEPHSSLEFPIRIINRGRGVRVKLELEGNISKIASLNKREIFLYRNEIETVPLRFTADEEGVYHGFVVCKAGGEEKRVRVVTRVEKKSAPVMEENRTAEVKIRAEKERKLGLGELLIAFLRRIWTWIFPW